MKRTGLIIVLIPAILVVAVWFSPPFRRFRRSYRAQKLYVHAISLYMAKDVDGAARTFQTIAQRYADLPIGAMAQVKLAFLAYDADDDEGPDSHNARTARLDRAEKLFKNYLHEHPHSVMYLSNSPMPDYEGELELVAWYFLGRIAEDRGNTAEQRVWYEKIASTESENPGNIIVSKVAVLLRETDEAARKEGASAE